MQLQRKEGNPLRTTSRHVCMLKLEVILVEKAKQLIPNTAVSLLAAEISMHYS